ncbi:hypothetical protein RB200_29280 [Streptomyces sp. PmtG]
MTQQRRDGAAPADAATAYLTAFHDRLAADGCEVTAASWRGHRVVVGSRSDRKARWFGTKVEVFALAAAVPDVDHLGIAAFTGWALDRAKDLRSGLPGARNAAMVLPALVSESVQPSASDWAGQDARLLGATVIGRPVTVETPVRGAARVTLYRGGTVYGGMFTRHVLEKAAAYYP